MLDENENGIFLVRDSTTSRGDYVLSVLYNESVTHYQIRRHQDDSFFSIFDPTPVHGLDKLIDYYRENQGDLVTTLNKFIKNKPPPSYDTLSGKTNLLHRVISIGNLDLVKEVISDKSRNMETKNELGQTAAHITSISGRDEIMEMLLKRRINLSCRDTEGYTPLHYACRGNSGALIKMLLDAKAPIQARNIKNGHVALHQAAQYGSLVAVKLLLEYGAPHLPRTTYGETPIDLARTNNFTEIVEYFEKTYKVPNPTTFCHEWHHGTLSRKESVLKLRERLRELNLENNISNMSVLSPYETGIYLVRNSPNQGNKETLSLLYENEDKHFVIEEIFVSILYNFSKF